MKTLDLSSLSWHVRGWRPYAWQLSYSMEMGAPLEPDVPAVPAHVPGSVQSALRCAGILPDWNKGLNSRLCEWVENRHWEFFTEIQVTPDEDGRIILNAEGLDYSGWILIDGHKVADFKGALVPHRFDLTKLLRDGQPKRLSIVFDEPPGEQGQIGFTSQSRHFKPRFNYSWDWCPRLVPIGIWDALSLEQRSDCSEVTAITATVKQGSSPGELSLGFAASDEAEEITITIRRGRDVCAQRALLVKKGAQSFTVELPDVKLWWPNGEGEQPLYNVECCLRLRDGNSVAFPERTVGFKRVCWLSCQDAPAVADPWICEINGKPVFLRGVNWTPIRLDFHSVTDAEYAERINLYQKMGCNLLRIWGGGFLEKEIFYRLCDEAGLLVWQEFPLSSSGLDNWAPEDPGVIEELCGIATSYVRRRRHHVSKLLWCGGNELQSAPGKKTGAGVPLNGEHPCLAALAKVVEREDPGTRFLPASSSGPQFCASEDNFGKGLHHDVHGPWNVNDSMDDWNRYWLRDDALFRSETGVPSTSPLSRVEKYRGDCSPWPPTAENPYWLHAGAWWMQWKQLKDQVGDCPPEEAWSRYVELSLALQAKALGVAAAACRDRFPACGGILIWMGHDAFPCLANTSIIDFDGQPKPAYHALQAVFTKIKR